jgi:hypothetical protein
MTLGRNVCPSTREERMMSREPLWLHIKWLEETMSEVDQQDVANTILLAVAERYDVVLGIWSKRDMVNLALATRDVNEDEAVRVADYAWPRIKYELELAVNNLDTLDAIGSGYIEDAIEEELG